MVPTNVQIYIVLIQLELVNNCLPHHQQGLEEKTSPKNVLLNWTPPPYAVPYFTALTQSIIINASPL